jgi:hypothetical protein
MSPGRAVRLAHDDAGHRRHGGLWRLLVGWGLPHLAHRFGTSARFRTAVHARGADESEEATPSVREKGSPEGREEDQQQDPLLVDLRGRSTTFSASRQATCPAASACDESRTGHRAGGLAHHAPTVSWSGLDQRDSTDAAPGRAADGDGRRRRGRPPRRRAASSCRSRACRSGSARSQARGRRQRAGNVQPHLAPL